MVTLISQSTTHASYPTSFSLLWPCFSWESATQMNHENENTRRVHQIAVRVLRLFRSDLLGPGMSLAKGVELTIEHIFASLYIELHDCLLIFSNFVPSQRLIDRNVCELFSSNRGVSHLHNQ